MMVAGLVKSLIPVLGCVIGLCYCTWRIHQNKYAVHFRVEITVHGPDGRVIPAIAHR
jgi:hypothetical protein